MTDRTPDPEMEKPSDEEMRGALLQMTIERLHYNASIAFDALCVKTGSTFSDKEIAERSYSRAWQMMLVGENTEAKVREEMARLDAMEKQDGTS